MYKTMLTGPCHRKRLDLLYPLTNQTLLLAISTFANNKFSYLYYTTKTLKVKKNKITLLQ